MYYTLTEQVQDLINKAKTTEDIDFYFKEMKNRSDGVTAALARRREELELAEADAFLDDFLGSGR